MFLIHEFLQNFDINYAIISLIIVFMMKNIIIFLL
jgi:hypothetical protein